MSRPVLCALLAVCVVLSMVSSASAISHCVPYSSEDSAADSGTEDFGAITFPTTNFQTATAAVKTGDGATETYSDWIIDGYKVRTGTLALGTTTPTIRTNQFVDGTVYPTTVTSAGDGKIFSIRSVGIPAEISIGGMPFNSKNIYYSYCIFNEHATRELTSLEVSYELKTFWAQTLGTTTVTFHYQIDEDACPGGVCDSILQNNDLVGGTWVAETGTNGATKKTGMTAGGSGDGNTANCKRVVDGATISLAGTPVGPGDALILRWTQPAASTELLAVDTLTINAYFTSPSVAGDPWFVGFNGQSFQVHGASGAIYNLISMSCFQLNALFSFIGKEDGRTPNQLSNAVAEAANGKKYSLQVKSTKQWTHPGNYLGQIGIKVGNNYDVVITSGKWESGFSSVTVNGAEITVGTPMRLAEATATQELNLHRDDIVNPSAEDASVDVQHQVDVHNSIKSMSLNSIHRFSTHHVMLQLEDINLLISNADDFVNIDHVAVHHMSQHTTSSIEGLLGQTARPHGMKDNGVKVTGEDDLIHEFNRRAMKERGVKDNRAARKYDTYAQDSKYHIDDYRVDSITGVHFLENRFRVNSTSGTSMTCSF